MVERHMAKRGEWENTRAEIIRQLVGLYPERMTFRGLLRGLLLSGQPVDERELGFQLRYLEEGGYISIERQRVSQTKSSILCVTATRKAIDLKDGRIEPDPGIAL